jgi:hypothetical protein
MVSTTQDGSDSEDEIVVLKAVNTIVSFYHFFFHGLIVWSKLTNEKYKVIAITN